MLVNGTYPWLMHRWSIDSMSGESYGLQASFKGSIHIAPHMRNSVCNLLHRLMCRGSNGLVQMRHVPGTNEAAAAPRADQPL